MKKIKFYLKRINEIAYEIEIGQNLFKCLISDIKNKLVPNVSNYAIITDSNVRKLYGNSLYEKMKESGIPVEIFDFPAGENNKTRETKSNLEDQLLKSCFGRDSCIIALGGGAVTDLAGFLAGTFGRGVPYINYATTLLAATDASVGGKTAVNTPVGTNLIGIFHQPVKVYIDVSMWSTLPKREIKSGLAETIIHACLADYDFFVYLENNIDKLIYNNELILTPEVCEFISWKNCDIKLKIVMKDERESNYRQVLNLGHTGGRAIEALSEYKLLHGEAISIGMMIQVILALKLNMLTLEDAKRIVKLFNKAGLPTSIPIELKNEDLIERMFMDKKRRNGQICFVLQEGIGKIKQHQDDSYSLPINEELILEVLNEIHAGKVLMLQDN